MAGRKEDEDYWLESDTKAFSFEEEENGSQLCGVSRSGTARLSQQVRADMGKDRSCFSTDSLSGSLSRVTTSVNTPTATRPLHELISEKALACILDSVKPLPREAKGSVSVDEEVRILRRKVEDRWTPPPVKHTITKILLGHPYSLELYRSLASKTELLDAAINMGDGNAILAVVLFLVKTLKKSLVNQLLLSRPDAVSQYVQYLTTRLQVHELTDLLEMLGRSRDAAMKQFQMAVKSTQDSNRRLQKLRACVSNHFSGADSRDKELVTNYIKLMEWQIAMEANDAELAQGLVGKSVLASLAHTCKHHWSEPKGSFGSPLTLCQQHGVSERQFQWTVVTVRASVQAWDDIESHFITKSWLGGKKLKAALPMEDVVIQLHANKAPPDVLMKYLQLIDNLEKRMSLAQKLQCHKAAIDIFISQRDRRSLINYKANLHPQSEDYFYAENALRVSSTKWKN